jgi:hypothetical protein
MIDYGDQYDYSHMSQASSTRLTLLRSHWIVTVRLLSTQLMSALLFYALYPTPEANSTMGWGFWRLL